MTHTRFTKKLYQTNEIDYGFTDKRVAIKIFHNENKGETKHGDNQHL